MMEAEMLTRRKLLPLFGFAWAIAGAILAIPTDDAEAQTAGMERRHQRRQNRVERRYERRGGQPASKQPTQGQPTQSQPGTQK
jgi:hypothetical protein